MRDREALVRVVTFVLVLSVAGLVVVAVVLEDTALMVVQTVVILALAWMVHRLRRGS